MNKVHLQDLNIKEFEPNWIVLDENKYPQVLVNVAPSSQEYLQLMSDVADLLGVDDTKVVNRTKLGIIIAIESIRAITNVEFTEEELEDYGKLYDRLDQDGFIKQFLSLVKIYKPDFFTDIYTQIQDLYTYNTSAYGIMEGITKNYKDTEFDVEKLNKELADENSVPLLKEIITKLG